MHVVETGCRRRRCRVLVLGAGGAPGGDRAPSPGAGAGRCELAARAVETGCLESWRTAGQLTLEPTWFRTLSFHSCGCG